MDGENGLRVADGRVLEQRAQIHRHERRLPVVAVDDVGYPVHVVERGQRGLAEEAVPGDIVHEVQIRVAGGEELLVVDEVVDDAVVHILHDADVVVAAGVAEVHVELAAVDHLVLVLLRDACVAGENDADVAVEPCELAGQGVHDVAQAAGLDEGVALGADERHAPARQGGNVKHWRSLLNDGSGFLDDGRGLLNDGSSLLNDGGDVFHDDGSGFLNDGSGFLNNRRGFLNNRRGFLDDRRGFLNNRCSLLNDGGDVFHDGSGLF